MLFLWLWDFGNPRFGSGLCGWLIRSGAGLPMRLTGFFHATRTIALGSEGLLQGEEAREVGVFGVRCKMEGLASRFSTIWKINFFFFCSPTAML